QDHSECVGAVGGEAGVLPVGLGVGLVEGGHLLLVGSFLHLVGDQHCGVDEAGALGGLTGAADEQLGPGARVVVDRAVEAGGGDVLRDDAGARRDRPDDDRLGVLADELGDDRGVVLVGRLELLGAAIGRAHV